MTVRLKPELAQFVADQVKAGRYATVEDAVNAAVDRARAEEELLAGEMSDADLAAIDEGLAEADGGELRPWAEVRQELRAKYLDGR